MAESNQAVNASIPKRFETKGTVIGFDSQRGYGSVQPDDERYGILFLPERCLTEHGLTTVKAGTRLSCKAERKSNGKKYHRVKHILKFEV